jgi:hypothetical protein
LRNITRACPITEKSNPLPPDRQDRAWPHDHASGRGLLFSVMGHALVMFLKVEFSHFFQINLPLRFVGLRYDDALSDDLIGQFDGILGSKLDELILGADSDISETVLADREVWS